MTEETKKPEAEGAEEEQEAPAAPAADDTQASEEDPKASDDTGAEEVEVPEHFKALVESVEKMTVLELNELVKVLEKKFGVSATAVAAAPAGGDAGGAEEKDEFTVELTSDGGNKIAVIKVVKEVAGLGLKEAKELVESAPAAVKENVKKEEAEEVKAKLEEAGAKVELK